MNLNFIGTVFFCFSSKGRVCLSSLGPPWGAFRPQQKDFVRRKEAANEHREKVDEGRQNFLAEQFPTFRKSFATQPPPATFLSAAPATTLALRNIFYYVHRGTIRKLLYFITNGFEPSRLSFFPSPVHVYQPVEIFLLMLPPPPTRCLLPWAGAHARLPARSLLSWAMNEAKVLPNVLVYRN